MNTSRIIYGSTLAPTLLEESVFFSTERPYTISIKQFESDEITIPHYAETLELLLCGDVMGEVTIEKTHFSQITDRVFIIPPYTVHSMRIRASVGRIYVLKCSLEYIAQYIQLSRFLAASGFDFHTLPIICEGEQYRQICDHVIRMVEQDDNLFIRMSALLEIFGILVGEAASGVSLPAIRTDTAIRKLIDWTLTNYSRPIPIEKAAETVGYSRYYFCRWFRERTGMTYLSYLTQVRMNQAARLLRKGITVGEVCRLCGYESVSHFIRQFTESSGITPKQYVKLLSP